MKPRCHCLAAVALVFTLAPTVFVNNQDAGVPTFFVWMEINLEVGLKPWSGFGLGAPSHHTTLANSDK